MPMARPGPDSRRADPRCTRWARGPEYGKARRGQADAPMRRSTSEQRCLVNLQPRFRRRWPRSSEIRKPPPGFRGRGFEVRRSAPYLSLSRAANAAVPERKQPVSRKHWPSPNRCESRDRPVFKTIATRQPPTLSGLCVQASGRSILQDTKPGPGSHYRRIARSRRTPGVSVQRASLAKVDVWPNLASMTSWPLSAPSGPSLLTAQPSRGCAPRRVTTSR